MTPADLLRAGACGPRCLLAKSAPTRCTCACQGEFHGLLTGADITTLADARRTGLHKLNDRDIVATL